MSDFLRVEKVEKEYPSGDTILQVLKGVTLDVAEGRITAIVGPSGAGKSTLLHLMGFLDRPTSGEIIYRGRSLSGLDRKQQARLRNESFGFVFQLYHLLPELTALENTLLPLMIRRSTGNWLSERGANHAQGRSLLDRLGLAERLHHLPHQLSGGERQRVAIARALVGDPDVVFCDEPTGNLDAGTSKEIQNIIVQLSEETKKTFIIVTHDPHVAGLAHRQLKLVDGRFVDEG